MHQLLFFHINCHYRYIFLLFLFLLQLQSLAQKKSSYQDSIFKKYASTSIRGYEESKLYYVIESSNSINASLKITRQLDEHLAIIEIPNQTEFELLNKQVKLAAATDTWKLSPQLEKLFNNNKIDLQQYILTGKDFDELVKVLDEKQNNVVIVSVNRPSNSVVIKCKEKILRDQLMALKEVIFIDAATEAHPETNIIGYDRSFHGINAVDFLIPGANGRDIVSGVKEQKMDETDLDLWKRVLPSPIEATTKSHHATVIASIIGGAGNSSYEGRGIAWRCKFFSSSFSNLFADDPAILNSNKVTVQNHSYGTVIQQFYGAEAVSYDAHTWLDRHFVHVISAGNQGESFASEGRYANLPGFANHTGNFKMAKNIITVGAIDNKENISAQSSAGPTYDGRIAPQLIALGPNGTSDAAAIVSGTTAVMQQVYADSNNQALPAASLIKAVLYNTAEDIYKVGIDYKTGYGLLNSYAAIKSLQQKNFNEGLLSHGQRWTKNISVPPNTAQLKVTLSWTDSAATVNNNKALINDLDLEVIEVATGNIYQPWVLSTAPNKDSLTKEPTRKRDSLNIAEQVSLQVPPAGDYQVRVTGTKVYTPSLPFHITYIVDTLNTFNFTSPQHASDVNREENEMLNIRWKTYVADTNETGNLYISYDFGNSWQPLAQSIRLTNKKLQWQIKDTSSVARLKMETSFGAFLSNNFLISEVIRPAVDFNCTDSFRLSWNKHAYADSYRIYSLTNHPNLEPVLTVTDTFAVLQRSVYPSLVYAVEPVLNSNLSASRSVALNIELQGVQCFYKTLNYNLLDFNKLNLLLELSVASYADSVYFEKVSSSGQLLQTYGGAKVINNNLIYTQLVAEVPSGITYLRGRIKLNSGAIVYTSVISVLTSGNKNIL
ncbi:MAG TPA: S8 family serine peptidase, partial [Segetibacter sp.]